MAAHVAALGLTVVTQPGFVAERGDDYLADVDAEDRPYLWRCGLVDRRRHARRAPAPTRRSATPDPWRGSGRRHRSAHGQRARCSAPASGCPGRRRSSRFLAPLAEPGGAARRVAAGAAADLCLLGVALDDALAAPSRRHVLATVAGGRLTYRGLSAMHPRPEIGEPGVRPAWGRPWTAHPDPTDRRRKFRTLIPGGHVGRGVVRCGAWQTWRSAASVARVWPFPWPGSVATTSACASTSTRRGRWWMPRSTRA